MPSPERSQFERETLIFPTAPEAARFRERVQSKLTGKNTAAQKQQTAEELAAQFAAHGETVSLVREPWNHTPAEHEEVQVLVNVAFQRDLGAAIKQARQSPHYPRNLDLLHDVLTGEMYDLLKEGGLNRQSFLGVGLIVALGCIVLVGLVFAILLFI